MNSMRNPALSIEEVLTRQTAEILPDRNSLESLMNKRKIRLYLGIDPTGANLHLGHAIALRKLQQFADQGHEAILVVGTGTVLAGDPSQRESARPHIQKEEIAQNIRTWRKQAGKVLDFSRVKIKRNGDWLIKLKLKDILEIASHVSAARLFQRDMFQRRLEKGDTVWMHETLYPLLQGYDSVAMDVDLEIGGTDQLFNMLIGRELQQKMRHKEKFVLTVPMLEGLDGKPMSKTSGNTVNLTDSSQDMYGKLMTLQDELVARYFELCTDASMRDITKLRQTLSPRDLKARLARTIVQMYHGPKAATAAQKEFGRVFREKKLPSEIPTVEISKREHSLIDLLVETKLATSKSHARRLVEQGGVRIDGVVQKTPQEIPSSLRGKVIQAGKRRFVRIT